MRRIAVIADSRATWSRGQSVCEAIQERDDLQLELVVCGPMKANWKSMTTIQPTSVLDTYFTGIDDTPFGMVESSSNLLMALGSYLTHNQPDIVVALTDRYETLCVAQAAALMNIRVAHVQGGEVTGTIDESIRHAVTKLSHIHFPATEEARLNIVCLGEDTQYIFNVGCPATDLLLRVDVTERPIEEPYILFLMHPVTTEYEAAYEQTMAVIEGIRAAWDGLVVRIGPGHDAGNYGVWEAIKDAGLRIPHTVEHGKFVRLMAHAEVMVGNSSAGIREACYFGTPVVDVGSRQSRRSPRSMNIIWSSPVDYMVENATRIHIEDGRIAKPKQLYGDGTAGKQIAEILATIDLPPIQKRLMY